MPVSSYRSDVARTRKLQLMREEELQNRIKKASESRTKRKSVAQSIQQSNNNVSTSQRRRIDWLLRAT
ncbi:hypothetical protein Leryth_017386, partial [Lithospermum erythrorhizon]